MLSWNTLCMYSLRMHILFHADIYAQNPRLIKTRTYERNMQPFHLRPVAETVAFVNLMAPSSVRRR